MSKTYMTIEFGNGFMYRNNRYTVYQHTTNEEEQQEREWVEEFDTFEQAKSAYPQAKWSGPTYRPLHPDDLPHRDDDRRDDE